MASIIVVIVLVVLVTLFSVQNAMPVAISFLVWEFSASLAIIALLFFLGGVISGAGILFWVGIRRKTRKKRTESEKQQGRQEPGA